MSELTKKVTINVSADEVWKVLADFGSVSKWTPTIKTSHCITEAKQGVGAKRELNLVSGKIVVEEITEWDEEQSFTFKFPDGFGPIKTLHEVWSIEKSSEKTVVTVKMDFKLKFGIVGAVIDRLVRKRMNELLLHNLAGLRYHVETGESVTSTAKGLPIQAVE